MLCTRVAVLQRKENVQIQTSHSKCKRKKRSCENKIKVICLPNVAFHHHIICIVSKKKPPLTPKAIIQTEKMWRYRERGWRQELIWGNIFLLSVLSLRRPGKIWATEPGEKSDSQRSNLREKQQLGRFVLCDLSSAKSTSPFWEQFLQSKDSEEVKRRRKRDGRAVQLEGNGSAA